MYPHHRHAEHQLAAIRAPRGKLAHAAQDQLKVSYSLSESGHDTKVSWLTGKALSHKANIIASKSYNTQSDYRFDMKTFMELRNAQSVVLAYDGIDPKPPMFCYLKPYYNDPNESYFVQLAKGKL